MAKIKKVDVQDIDEQLMDVCQVENKLDKVRFHIPDNFTHKRWISGKGLGYIAYTSKGTGTVITLSGKIMASPDNLGLMTKENIYDVVIKLNATFELNLTVSDLLYECQLFSVDVTRDILVDGNDCRPYITALREVAQKNTKRRTVTGFKQKTCAYDESLLIRTTTKRNKKSLSIYSKYKELINGRHKDKAYFSLFSDSFIEYSKRLIRFEVRLNSFAEMRTAFSLDKGNIYLFKVFNSTEDVVGNTYKELVLGE